MQFTDLGLIDPILQAVAEEGYTTPTPIQQQAIPSLLLGNDLLGCAQTGTGKTAAFAIPILQQLYKAEQHKGARRVLTTLVLTPTRELAIQIAESFGTYGKYTNLKHTVIFGGVGQFPQVQAIKNGVNILVATPGRLLDLIGQGHIHLDHIKMFVLDEADRMLDMGFVHDVKKILKMLPQKRQSLFFSATMPPTIVSLADSILRNPVKVEVTPVSSTADTITQHLYHIDKNNKRLLLCDLIAKHQMPSVLVFTRTKHGADKVVKELLQQGISAAAIHGNKSQTNRQNALNNFKDGKIVVLVATDIAARGIDVDNLSFVINYEIPNVAETYVHRIGRTGRAGANGVAFSFAEAEELPYIKDIQKLIGKPIPLVEYHEYPMKNFDVVAAPKPQRGGGRPSRPGGGSPSAGSFKGNSHNNQSGSHANSSYRGNKSGGKKSSSGVSAKKATHQQG